MIAYVVSGEKEIVSETTTQKLEWREKIKLFLHDEYIFKAA